MLYLAEHHHQPSYRFDILPDDRDRAIKTFVVVVVVDNNVISSKW